MKVYNYLIDKKTCYIITEFAHGGELLDRLIAVKQLSEKMVANITKQILQAINYAWQNGQVQHLDLKPENLMLENQHNMRLKILDFGLNEFIGEQKYLKIKKNGVS